MLTMQDALTRLTAYWTDQGCLVVQPMNTEVGAGTLNPATLLRGSSASATRITRCRSRSSTRAPGTGC
ncbi:glycine--tRNA ligase subunit alpha [Actinoplanes philippinensis]